MITKELQEFSEAMAARFIRTDETGEANAMSVGSEEKGFLVIQDLIEGEEIFYIEDGMDPRAKNIARLVGTKHLIAFGLGFFR
ncbi:Hypothetical protein MONT_33 [Glutamicibacter phage Montesquieu]|nr:Hypothetical protein MONT_33 [Glutamicibacter phage Montesquieu]